jgi:hypothetical protein
LIIANAGIKHSLSYFIKAATSTENMQPIVAFELYVTENAIHNFCWKFFHCKQEAVWREQCFQWQRVSNESHISLNFQARISPVPWQLA